MGDEPVQAYAERDTNWAGWIGVVALVLVVIGAFGFIVFRGGSDAPTTVPPRDVTAAGDTVAPNQPAVVPPPSARAATITGDTPCPPADGSAPRTTTFAKPPPMCIDPAKAYAAQVVTSKGILTIDLDAKAAPNTVNNFVVLARYHFYDGIAFHRIVPGFVVQGGDPLASGYGGPGYTFADELPPPGPYPIGSLAMANSGPNTDGSQFFIVVGADGSALPPKYSRFGQVSAGMDVVKAIEALGTPSSAASPGGQPREVVTIQSVGITES